MPFNRVPILFGTIIAVAVLSRKWDAAGVGEK